MDCPQCGRRIPVANVNMRHMAAKCDACEEIFSLTDRFPSTQEGGAVSERSAPPRPAHLNVEVQGGRLQMSYRWRAGHLFMLIPFTIAWNGFLVGWYTMAVHIPGPAKLIMLVFPIAHLAAGLFMVHLCLTGLFNRTTITVDRTAIEIRHGPIPAGGNVRLNVHEVEQLFCRGKTNTDSDGDTTHHFSLHAVLRDGLRRDLLINESDRDLVQFVEYMIEAHLGLEDRPVEGELSKA